MKYFINLKIDTLAIQSLSDVSDVKIGCVQIEFELESELTQEIKDSDEFKLAVVRALRDKYLLDTIWINERHLSQLPIDRNLSDADYLAWQMYWQELRDLPEQTMTIFLIDLVTMLPTQPS